MSWTREDFIREYKKLRECHGPHGIEDADKYYAIEMPLVSELYGLVVVLEDGETCIYEYDSSVMTGRLLK